MNTNETLQMTTTTTMTTMKRYKCNIHYAKFFTFPNTTPVTSLLRPRSRGQKKRLTGTWVPCSTPNVALQIDASVSGPKILVSLNGFAYEEHYVSNLNFLWPQGHGLDESSVRGSRVIFACYRDRMGQVQKFAMRFSSSQECQEFIEVLKSLKGEIETNLLSIVPSNVFSKGVDMHTTQLINHERALGAYLGPQQEAFGHAPESSNMALPQSINALLADCFTAVDPGTFRAPAETDLKLFLGAGSKADKPLIDLLEKMDNIIVGLVGDLNFVGAEA